MIRFACRLIYHGYTWPFLLFPKVVALSKRSQEAEAAFWSVYKQLIETPGKKCLGSVIKELIRRNSHCTGTSSCWGMGTGWLLGKFMPSMGGNYGGEWVLCPVWCDIPTWLLHLPLLSSNVNLRAPGGSWQGLPPVLSWEAKKPVLPPEDKWRLVLSASRVCWKKDLKSFLRRGTANLKNLM